MEAQLSEGKRQALQTLWSSLPGGKKVSKDTYFHIEHPSVQMVLQALPRDLEIPPDANVIKVGESKSGPTISFLNYRDFFDDPFPSLVWSHHVTLSSGAVVKRTEGKNPAILHRKELLVAPNDSRRSAFVSLTEELVRNKLLPARSFIGRKEHWQKYLRQNGYEIRASCLHALAKP